jgi:hypothetical protein
MVLNQTTMAAMQIVWHSGKCQMDINGLTILAISNAISFVKSK